MAPTRKLQHANFKMSLTDSIATRQLRNLLIKHTVTPLQSTLQLAHGRRCHNSAPASLTPDLDKSLDDD